MNSRHAVPLSFLNKNVCNWLVNIYRNNFLQCTLKVSSETDSHLRGIFPFKFGRKMLSKDLCMKTTKRFHWWWELMLAVHIYRVWKQRHIYKTRTDLVFVSCFYLLIFWVENKSEDIFWGRVQMNDTLWRDNRNRCLLTHKINPRCCVFQIATAINGSNSRAV